MTDESVEPERPTADAGACNGCGSRERVKAFRVRGYACRACESCRVALITELRRIRSRR